MQALECPSRDRLVSFVLGKVNDEGQLALQEHVTSCQRCVETLRSTQIEGDTLLEVLRETVEDVTFLEESECRKVVTLMADSTPGEHGSRAIDESEQLGLYRLDEKVGQGGMGAVYRAWHTLLDRQVAVKVLTPARLTQPDAVERFFREIRASGKLKHPNVVEASDAGEVDGTHYLVMEWIDGSDLSEVLRRRGPFSVGEACEMVRQAALGLQHAHEHGLIHRDVKPSNLLLTSDGVVKVCDLGLARLQESPTSAPESGVTSTGQVMGTFDYLAPEQARDTSKVDFRTDIYSLGCTLYTLLSGKAPFSNRDPVAKLLAHQLDPVTPVTESRSDIPAPVLAILEKMMAKNPSERFESMQSVAVALGPHSTSLDMPAKPGAESRRTTTLESDDSTMSYEPDEVAKSSDRAPGIRPLAVVLAMLLLVGLIIAGVVVRLRTTNGTLEVHVTEPGVKVFVDGNEKIVIDSTKMGRIELTPGKHRISVKRGDEVLHTESFTLERGGVKVIEAKWVPGGTPSKPVKGSMFDSLDPKDIPEEERYDWQPEGLVAVLGSHAFRDWTEGISIAWSPDGKLLATKGSTGCRLWDVKSKRQVALLPTTSGLGLAFSPNKKLLACGGSNSVQLWDYSTFPPKKTESVKGDLKDQDVRSVCFSPDGKLLAFGQGVSRKNGLVILWDMSAGKRIATLPGHTSTITSLAFSPDGKSLFSAAHDGTARWWKLQGEKVTLKQTLEHRHGVKSLAIDSDGACLATGGEGASVRLWGLTAPNVVRKSEFDAALGNSPFSAYTFLSFQPEKKVLGVAMDEYFALWNVGGETPKLDFYSNLHTYAGSKTTAFSPDGGTVAWSDGNLVRLLTQSKQKWEELSSDGLSPTTWIRSSSDGRQLFVRSGSHVYCWKQKLGAWRQSVLLDDVAATVVSNNGRSTIPSSGKVSFLVGGGRKPILKALDLPDSKPIGLEFPEKEIAGLETSILSDDGSRLALGSTKGRITIWDVTGMKPQFVSACEGHDLKVWSLAFSPDGNRLASRAFDSTVRLWNVRTGEQLAQYLSRGSYRTAVTFSSDGRLLASGGTHGESSAPCVKLWNVKTGKEVRLLGHTGVAYPCGPVFSPDDKLIAWTIERKPYSVVVCEVATGRIVRQWKHPGPIASLAFSPEGRHLLTGNGNGTIYVIRLGSESDR